MPVTRTRIFRSEPDPITSLLTTESLGTESLIPVLLFVVFEVVTGANVGDPFGVFAVPANGLAQAFFKGDRWAPTEFALDLAAIDRIATVVPRAVLDVANHRARLVHDIEQGVSQLKVAVLVPAADVVDFADTASSPNALQ